MYDKIQSEYNHYISSKCNAMGKTEFKKYLAGLIGTTLSNIYEIIKSGLITVLNSDLTERIEFSAELAWNKRTKKSIESNSSKRISAKPFIELVIKEFRSEYNINSIDEIINDLKLNRTKEIQGLTTICTATFYNYVDLDKIENFDKEAFDSIPQYYYMGGADFNVPAEARCINGKLMPWFGDCYTPEEIEIIHKYLGEKGPDRFEFVKSYYGNNSQFKVFPGEDHNSVCSANKDGICVSDELVCKFVRSVLKKEKEEQEKGRKL